MSEPTDTSTTPSAPSALDLLAAKFANEAGITVDEAKAGLEKITGKDAEKAVIRLADDAKSPFSFFEKAFPDVPPSALLDAVQSVRTPKAPPPVKTLSTSDGNAQQAFKIELPSRQSLLAALTTGGVLEVSEPVVLSGVQVALADRFGYFDILDLLKIRIKEYARKNSLRLPAKFYDIQSGITRNVNSELLAAVGLTKSAVSKEDRDDLLAKVRSKMFPAAYDVYQAARAWSIQNQEQMPALMTAMFLRQMNPDAPQLNPLGMVEAVDTSGIKATIDHAIDEINECFMVAGIPAALYLDDLAQEIRKFLEDPELPRLIGADTRKQMLERLEINLTQNSDKVLEDNMLRFFHGIMLFRNASPNDEVLRIQQILATGNALESSKSWAKVLDLGKIPKSDDLTNGRHRKELDNLNPPRPTRPQAGPY